MASTHVLPPVSNPPLEAINPKSKKNACICAANALGISAEGSTVDVKTRIMQYIKDNSAVIAMNPVLQPLLNQAYRSVEQSGSRTAPAMQSSDKALLDLQEAEKPLLPASGALKTVRGWLLLDHYIHDIYHPGLTGIVLPLTKTLADLKVATDPPARHSHLGGDNNTDGDLPQPSELSSLEDREFASHQNAAFTEEENIDSFKGLSDILDSDINSASEAPHGGNESNAVDPVGKDMTAPGAKPASLGVPAPDIKPVSSAADSERDDFGKHHSFNLFLN
ncbi:hypothetical protein C8J56DRAFT_1048556 [Mycena floridula]|nr:hypothetical protein C8J56DRAFT_1048556 [Mycena floridula]